MAPVDRATPIRQRPSAQQRPLPPTSTRRLQLLSLYAQHFPRSGKWLKQLKFSKAAGADRAAASKFNRVATIFVVQQVASSNSRLSIAARDRDVSQSLSTSCRARMPSCCAIRRMAWIGRTWSSDNLTLMPLPPRRRELKLVENVWSSCAKNWLFKSYLLIRLSWITALRIDNRRAS
jgi:hypothetical protein